MSLHDLDAIVVSSCLDPIRYDKNSWGFNEIDQNKIHYISHHLSHAYSSFLISSFEEAIIIVIDSVCLAGGVALNCVVNSKTLKSTPIENLFVVPAAGDTGQCLGNALYGHSIILDQQDRPEGFSPFLGRVYTNYKKIVDK